MNINTLVNIEIDGVDMMDYPDFVDAYISYAEDINGNVLPDDMLARLTEDNQDFVQELAHEEMIWSR